MYTLAPSPVSPEGAASAPTFEQIMVPALVGAGAEPAPTTSQFKLQPAPAAPVRKAAAKAPMKKAPADAGVVSEAEPVSEEATAASLADRAVALGLHRVGARPGLFTYLRQTWDRRDFGFTLAKSRIQARNQANRLGMLWEVIKPTLNAILYGFIFGVLQGGNKPENYPAYVVIGVFLFELFSKAMSDGARSITGNRALVQSLNFPRLTLPISSIVQELMTFGPMLIVMGIYVVVLGERPQGTWFLIIPLVCVYTLFNTGIALICARLTVHLNDLTQLLPLITRLLFYSSGVLFSVDKIFAHHPWVIKVYDFHPVYQVLEIGRGLLLSDHHYNPHHWIFLCIVSVAVLAVGVVFFWKAEERYGREH